MATIANPARGEYAINLDKPRVLKYDLNAFVLFEDASGKKLDDAFSSDAPNLVDVRALIWCGLVHEDRSLSQEEAGSLVEYGFGDSYAEKLKWLIGECGSAFTLSWPTGSAKKKVKANAKP